MLSETAIGRLCIEFGARVKAARKNAGLSPQALSQLIGLSRSSIANLEAGRQRVPVHVIWKLSDALGVPVQHLVPETAAAVQAHRPTVSRFLKQEPRLADVSASSKQRVKEFLEANLSDPAKDNFRKES